MDRIGATIHGGHSTKSVVLSPSIPDEELYWSRKFHALLEKGPEDQFLNEKAGIASHVAESKDSNEIDINKNAFADGNQSKDIKFVSIKGLGVNDDNEPAPKNIAQDQVKFLAYLKGRAGDMMGLIGRQPSTGLSTWVVVSPSKSIRKCFPFNSFLTLPLPKLCMPYLNQTSLHCQMVTSSNA